MTVLHALLVMALCALTGSYTWGMRGTILGGERGAMLPGAALAIVLLQAGCVQPMSVLFPAAAVIGAAGMFFGGAQTYGETIAKTYAPKAGTRYFARLGLMIKGGGWFGVFGGLFSFWLTAVSGQLALWKIILFTALLPCVKWLGVLLFNFPQNPAKGKFPRIYFSEKRFEVWGGTLLLCVYLIAFAIVLRAWIMLLMTVFGFVFGALGFLFGNLFQTALDAKRENEKNLFARLQKTGVFSGWKGMECIFGAVGGLGVGFCWCLFYTPFVVPYSDLVIAHSGAWSAFPEKTANILLFAWLILFMLFVLRYMVPQDGKTAFSRFLCRTEDLLIFPLFCYLPVFLAATGCTLFTQVFSVSIMLYLLAEKIAFAGTERFETIIGARVLWVVLMLAAALMLARQLFWQPAFGMFTLFAGYILSYYVVYLYTVLAPLAFRRKDSRASFRSSLSWTVWAAVCVVSLLITGQFYFQ